MSTDTGELPLTTEHDGMDLHVDDPGFLQKLGEAAADLQSTLTWFDAAVISSQLRRIQGMNASLLVLEAHERQPLETRLKEMAAELKEKLATALQDPRTREILES